MVARSRIGVRGTPAVFTETGELIGGYLPPGRSPKCSTREGGRR